MIKAEELQQYFPFNAIKLKFYPLILREFEFFDMSKGEQLYTINRRAENTKYLTKGIIKVVNDKGREKIIKSTSLSSKYPIGDANKSNTLDATVASSSATGFQINSTFLDHFKVWCDVHDKAPADSPLRGHDSYEWVVGLLKCQSVQMLPQGNVGELFEELETRTVQGGEEVIAEGDPGDFCYIIADGEAEVFQCVAEGEQKVADLHKGHMFGEAALVSSEPRNASVRMKTDGLLMKLARQKFTRLVKAHVVRWITAQAAIDKITRGAVLLDVRETEEFERQGIRGSLNIPVNQIRKQIKRLDLSKEIITCSNLGSRCASAAFTLTTLGYDVYVLQGGINNLIRTLNI
ncbi:MAG: cyclic nucleotide-binding domain-containing protein [Marinicella sp.]